MSENKIKIHIRNNHWKKGSLPCDLEGEKNSSIPKDLFENIDFSELCITSKANVNFVDDSEVEILTKKMQGKKCSVCWKISPETCARHTE